MKQLITWQRTLLTCSLLVVALHSGAARAFQYPPIASESNAPQGLDKPNELLAAGLRIADRFMREGKHERNYRFDLALGALLELSTATGESKYREHAMTVVTQQRKWSPTTPVSYREQSFTCLTYGIYQATGDRAWLPVFLEESRKCRDDKSRSAEGAVVHPRGRERGGGEAMLLDSMQEYVARMARAGALTGDRTYFVEAARQIRLYKSVVRDPRTKLWHQGCGWLKDQPEQVSPGVWSRGHGWLLRGLTAALAEMPRDSDEYREMQATLIDLADALVERQQPTGMWHCLLDRPATASPPESSGTAMIATALARAWREGTLPGDKYRDAARRAFAALPAYVDQEGIVLSVSPGPGPLESEEPWLVASFPPDNDHGTFALMFAAAESVRFNQASTTLQADSPTSWQQLPMPRGLRHDKVRDLKFSKSGEMYVAFDNEGLWSSNDFGKTWDSIQYNLPALSTGGLLSFNVQGDVLFTPSSAAQRGIYRLPKEEKQWSPAKIDMTGMGGSHFPHRLILNKSGDIICATSATQVLRSTDGGKTFQHTGNRLAGAALFDMARNPSNADELVMGTETGPTWRSTDGGLNWTDIGKPAGGGNTRIMYNRQGALFASATHSALRLGWTLVRWTDGANWVRSDQGLPTGEDTRCSALSDSGWMFLGNTDVYVSKDDGQTWSLAGDGFPSAPKVRVHVRCLAIGPDGHLYAGVANSGDRLPLCGIWRLSIAARAIADSPKE